MLLREALRGFIVSHLNVNLQVVHNIEPVNNYHFQVLKIQNTGVDIITVSSGSAQPVTGGAMVHLPV